MKDKLGELPNTVETDCAPEEIISPEKNHLLAKNDELSVKNSFKPNNLFEDKQTESKMTILTENERLPQENDESPDIEDVNLENGGLPIHVIIEDLKELKLDQSESVLYKRGPYDGKRDGHPTQVCYGTQQIELSKVEYNPQSGPCKRKNIASNNQAFKFDRVLDSNCYQPYLNGPTITQTTVNNTGSNIEMKVIPQNGTSGGLLKVTSPEISPFQFFSGMKSPSDLTGSQFIQNDMIPTTVAMENNTYMQPAIGGIKNIYTNVIPNQMNISPFPKHLQKQNRPQSIESSIESDFESGAEGSPYSAPPGSPSSYTSYSYSSPPPSNMSTTSDDSGIVSMGSKSPYSDTSYRNIPSVDSAMGSSPPRYDISPPLEMNINIPAAGIGTSLDSLMHIQVQQGSYTGQIPASSFSELPIGRNYVHRFEGQPTLTDQPIGVSGTCTNVEGPFGCYPSINSRAYKPANQFDGSQNGNWISTPVVGIIEDSNSNRQLQGSAGGLNNLNDIEVSGIHTAVVPQGHQIASQILSPAQVLSSNFATGTPYCAVSDLPSNMTSGIPSSMTFGIPSSMTSGIPSSMTSGIPSSMTSGIPSSMTSGIPSSMTSGIPSSMTSGIPSSMTSGIPSSMTSGIPSNMTSGIPSSMSSEILSSMTSAIPLSRTSGIPSSMTSGIPSSMTSGIPSSITSGIPSSMTSGIPSSMTSGIPSSMTSGIPSSMTSGIPSSMTSGIPSSMTSGIPSSMTSGIPSNMIPVNMQQYEGSTNVERDRGLPDDENQIINLISQLRQLPDDSEELADLYSVLREDLQSGKHISMPPMPQVQKNNISPTFGQNDLANPLAPCIVPNGSQVMIPLSPASSPSNGAKVLVVPQTSSNSMASPMSLPGAPTFIIVHNVPEAPPLPQKKGPRNILPKPPAAKKASQSLSQSSKNPAQYSDAQKPISLPQTNNLQSMKQEPVAVVKQQSDQVVPSAVRLNNARRYVADISRNEILFQDEEGDMFLHVAVCQADSYMIQALLERIDREGLQNMIDQKNCKQQTPLYLAVATNKAWMVNLFIEHKADVNIPAQVVGSDGSSILMTYPIHLAASKGVSYLKTLEQLLKAPNLNLNQVNSTGQTAMHCAILSHRKISGVAQIDSIPTVATLLKAGADPNPQDMRSGKTPLMYAIETKDYSVVETMIHLFEPGKLRHIIKSQTFDGYTCLKITEGLKNAFDKNTWSKLWRLLNNAANS